MGHHKEARTMGRWFGMTPCRWRQAGRTCRLFAWGVTLLAAGTGCVEKKSPPPSPPRPELQPVVEWLLRHYRQAPPGKGWVISSVASQGEQVQITVTIPPDQASGLMRRPADEQFRQVAEQVCPGRGEPVWRLLPAGSSVKVLPSVSGQVFIEVDCRQ